MQSPLHPMLDAASAASDLKPVSSNRSITKEVQHLYLHRAVDSNSQAKQLGAEVRQRQDKIRLINDIIAEINNLTDDNNCLDIGTQAELLEKLQTARDLGVKIKLNQLKFNAMERDRLLENLHLAADGWDKENRSQTQKLEIHLKELDRLLMLLKDVQTKEAQAIRPMASGMRGQG